MADHIRKPRRPSTEYRGCITVSSNWRYFRPRKGDIVVATPPKSGTTWTQGILALLISGDPRVEANPSENSPWFDTKFDAGTDLADRLDLQQCRRHVKTHTPFDGIPIWDELNYIAVYRHPIDVHFSARNHVANYRPEVAQEIGVDLGKFPNDPRESFRHFVEGYELDHGCLQTIAHHYLTCLDLEPRANLLRLHFADMKRDLAFCCKRIAKHINIDLPPKALAPLIKAATFQNMKANANRFGLVTGGDFWRDDARFFHSGTSAKWEGILTESDLDMYNAAISGLMDDDARSWLEWGKSRQEQL